MHVIIAPTKGKQISEKELKKKNHFTVLGLKILVCLVFQNNYQFLKGSVEQCPIVPMQKEWADRIVQMIPENLRNKPVFKEVLQELFVEVHSNFNASMKKSMGKI